MKQIKSLLIVNRGEIASKIISTCKKLGIKSVAIYSKADQFAPFVLESDEAYAIHENSVQKSYQNIEKILAIVKKSGVDAVHPGYGFLSEDGHFAREVIQLGVLWVGPNPQVLHQVGNKLEVKKILESAPFKIVPGFSTEGKTIEQIKAAALQIGYPVLLKATTGGGGKGLRLVHLPEDMEVAIEHLTKEISQHLISVDFLLEKYFDQVKHIEVQILADSHGNCIHTFERDCSMQRRYQKIMEESPAPTLSEDKRIEVHNTAVEIAQFLKIDQIATVEFLFDIASETFYFLEVNPRIQVEHTVTERITGLDLISLQLHIASGGVLNLKQSDIMRKGHAIQARLCAESSTSQALPTTGRLALFKTFKVPKCRTYSTYKTNDVITHYYDNLVSKLVAHGKNREEALLKMKRLIQSTICLGLETNQKQLYRLINSSQMSTGTYTTLHIEKLPQLSPHHLSDIHEIGICMTVYLWAERAPKFGSLNGWRNLYYKPQQNTFVIGNELVELKYRYLNQSFEFYSEDGVATVEVIHLQEGSLVLEIAGVKKSFNLVRADDCFYIKSDKFFNKRVRFPDPEESKKDKAFVGLYKAPLAGEILDVYVKNGDKVTSGTHLLSLFSMKMEIKIVAETAGIVSKLHVEKAQLIDVDHPLIQVENMNLLQN